MLLEFHPEGLFDSILLKCLAVSAGSIGARGSRDLRPLWRISKLCTTER